jgi:hypothetical protein
LSHPRIFVSFILIVLNCKIKIILIMNNQKRKYHFNDLIWNNKHYSSKIKHCFVIISDISQEIVINLILSQDDILFMFEITNSIYILLPIIVFYFLIIVYFIDFKHMLKSNSKLLMSKSTQKSFKVHSFITLIVKSIKIISYILFIYNMKQRQEIMN